MKFLTVAAAVFASTALAVPTNPNNGGGACIPKPQPGGGTTSSGPGSNPIGTSTSAGPGTQTTGLVTTTRAPSTSTNTNPAPPATSTGYPSPGGQFHCPAGLYSNPQCCSADILGLADLDCVNPSRAPTSGDDFASVCSAVGKGAKCCVLPVAGQSLLCQDAIPGGGNPPGVGNPNPPSNPPPNPPSNPPSGGEFRCPAGLYSNAQCCSTDLLGLVDIDCNVPSRQPTSGRDFRDMCAATGKSAKCCVIPVAGQDVLCQDAIGAQ
ncbi:Hydrophobin 2 [Cordyceps javanica]|uniref:Hydrophobin 2 n=1 Tax=Cordyceps javanica TaxID=43265 RepID=A0A545V5K3_9HYPO|nr:Hydrophobin 2 [Cordyceps javanica]TQW08245.1 Hydrophobin 2 [Cordyceps javanica]